jgi:hypothetical protein
VRIAPKAVSNNPATPQAATGKTAGASFLELLSVGTGVDIFGIKGADSASQTGSDTASDSAQNQDAKSLASAFQAELSAGTSAATSTIEKATEQDQSSSQQTRGQQNGQSQNTNLSTTPAQNLGSFVPTTNAAQLLVAAQAVSHPMGKAGKQQAQQDAGQAATDAASSLATTFIAQPADLQLTSKLAQAADPSISGAIQTVANHDRQQLADASRAADSKAQQEVNPQIIANAAQMLQNSFAAGLPAAAQTDPLSQSDDGAATTSDNSASATQSASQGSKLATNPSVASTFLSAAIFPSSIDPTQSAGKANQFKTTATTFNANSNLANATTGTSAAKTGSQDSSGASSRNTQTGSDPVHAQTDASQTTTVAARSTDNGTAQAITFGAIAASHQSAPTHAAPASIDEVPHRTDEPASLPSDQSNTAASGATSGINSARLIQSMNETEMRVGMHSSEFGDISIRTMVSQQQVQAQISVDHNELSSALSAHIPAMQAKLGNEYGLHASIEVSQNGASFSSGERGQSSQRDQKAFVPSVQVEGATASVETDRIVLRAPSVSVVSDRLDIRA